MSRQLPHDRDLETAVMLAPGQWTLTSCDAAPGGVAGNPGCPSSRRRHLASLLGNDHPQFQQGSLAARNKAGSDHHLKNLLRTKEKPTTQPAPCHLERPVNASCPYVATPSPKTLQRHSWHLDLTIALASALRPPCALVAVGSFSKLSLRTLHVRTLHKMLGEYARTTCTISLRTMANAESWMHVLTILVW